MNTRLTTYFMIMTITLIGGSFDAVYAMNESQKSEIFIQQNNFSIVEIKDGLIEFGGWTSGGFIGNGTMIVDLEFRNGSKVKYDDISAFSVNYGKSIISSPESNKSLVIPDELGNGFIQNNNITLSGGGIVDNGFIQNNNITLSS